MPQDEIDFAALENRTDRLLKRLDSADVVELVGLVDALSAGCSQSRSETLWTLLVGLEAWRVDSGMMQKRRMTLRYPVTRDRLDALQQSIKPYSILRLRARVVDDPQFVRPEAKVEAIIELNAADPELAAFAHELQQPVIVEDATLGALELNRKLDRFEGHATWNGKRIQVDVPQDNAGGIERSLSTLRELLRDQDTWRARVDEFAVRRFLPMKNEGWIDDDEFPLNPDEFIEKMGLEALSVDQDSFTFLYDDGDMFWGHGMLIRGTLDAGPTHADIVG